MRSILCACSLLTLALPAAARAVDTSTQARTASTATLAPALPPLAVARSEARTATQSSGLRAKVSGYVQAEGVLYDQSSKDELTSAGEPLNDNRLLIRRARLRGEVSYSVLSGVLELDANTVRGPTIRLLAAEAALSWPLGQGAKVPLLSAAVGLFKMPFGFEVQEKTDRRAFLEESNAARALFPGDYDLGAKLQGGWRFLRYQLALINGEPTGERSFPARDPNAAKDLLGRLGVDLSPWEGLHLEAGLSLLEGRGFHRGTPATKESLSWKDTNANGVVDLSELQAVPAAPATPSESFARSAIGADARLEVRIPGVGPLWLFVELYFATNLDRALLLADPVASGRDLRERGLTTGLLQRIGDFGAGVRYDRYDPDSDSTSAEAIYSTLALLALWQPLESAKLSVQYEHQQNPLGPVVNGQSTTLADDSLTVRVQLGTP